MTVPIGIRVQVPSSLLFLQTKRSGSHGTYQNYQGTRDYLSEKYKVKGVSAESIRLIENRFKETAKIYGFGEIILPTIELENLYRRSVGETTDVVQKEMFSLTRGSDTLTLRPEGTAGAIRSYVQNKLESLPDESVKLFYGGSMFRYERPQAGRQREFIQLGTECIGSITPFTEAETISFASNFIASFGLKNVSLEINSIGCSTCRKNYKEKLLDFLETASLCDLCESRKESNTLRVLDCKSSTCQENLKSAPRINECLCDSCQEEFKALQEILTALGISYQVNPMLVRGLDYYAKTVFEFVETSIGAQSTLCAGGRYENLVEELGGSQKIGFGFALGLERFLIALSNQNVLPKETPTLDYYLIWTSEETRMIQMKVANTLRQKGFSVEMEFLPKKLKNQMKVANRKKAKFALILGEDELSKGEITVKDLNQGTQESKSLNDFL